LNAEPPPGIDETHLPDRGKLNQVSCGLYLLDELDFMKEQLGRQPDRAWLSRVLLLGFGGASRGRSVDADAVRIVGERWYDPHSGLGALPGHQFGTYSPPCQYPQRSRQCSRCQLTHITKDHGALTR